MGRKIEEQYTTDALNLGYRVLFLFVTGKAKLPKHLISKAQEIEDSGTVFEEFEWLKQRRASELFFSKKPIQVLSNVVTLEELLSNEKSNYRYYKAKDS